MLNIARIELLQVDLLGLLAQVDAFGDLVHRPAGHILARLSYQSLLPICLVLLLLTLLDERDLPDLISHILQALLLQLAHEALHGLHLGEEEVLIDPVQLALHAEADKRGDMRVRFGHQDVLTADHATLAEASDLMHPVLLGSRLSVHVLAFRSQFARGGVLLF